MGRMGHYGTTRDTSTYGYFDISDYLLMKEKERERQRHLKVMQAIANIHI